MTGILRCAQNDMERVNMTCWVVLSAAKNLNPHQLFLKCRLNRFNFRGNVSLAYGSLVAYRLVVSSKGGHSMQRIMCKGKIHRATVTQANLNYVGSITIDQDLLDAADIYPYEKVQVVNVSNGARLETYTIAGARGSGVICLNGAAARLNSEGDIVIIMSYAQYDEQEIRSLEPSIVFVDEYNRITETKRVALNEMLPVACLEAIH